MSKSEKQVEEEETVSLSDLEKSFQGVIQELVTDRSLEKFRIEYEKLHESLLLSHQHNSILAGKCDQLNKDIIKNVKQISNLVLLTQNDQRTIGNLRCEFEKAWKIIETSSEKEQRSRTIIESLKNEVIKLSQLISDTKSMEDEPVIPKQEAEEQRDRIKQEVETNESIINDLRNQIEQTRIETAKMEKSISEMKPIIDDTSDEIQDCMKNIIASREDVKKCQESMKEVQGLINQNEETKENNINTKIKKKGNIEELNRHLAQANDMIENIQDDVRKQNKINENLKSKLVYVQRATSATEKVHKGMEEKLAKQMKEAISNPQEVIKELNQERIDLESDFAEVKRYRDEIVKAKLDYRKVLCDNRLMTGEMNGCINSENLEARKYRLQSDTADKNVHDLSNLVGLQKLQTAQEIEGQKKVTNEISGMKASITYSGSIIASLDEDIKKSIDAKHDAINDINALSDVISSNKAQLDELNIMLTSIKAESIHYDSLKESMRYDRDTINKQIQSELIIKNDLKTEYDTIKYQSTLMKEEIREIDDKTAREHLSYLDLKNELEELEVKTEDYKLKTEERIKKSQELEEQVDYKEHVRKEGFSDIGFIKTVNDTIKQTIDSIKNKIAQRLVERHEQKSQIIVLTNIINQYYNSWNEIIKKIEDQKTELSQVIQRRNKLQLGCRTVDALRREKARCQKELIDAQGLVCAMEDELKHPITINKWTFLEATNPEVAEMLHMKQAILDEIANKLVLTRRLMNTKEVISKKIERIDRKLQYSKGTTYNTQFKFYTEVLKNKTKELNALTDEYNERNGVVVVKRSEITTVRGELKTERSGFLETKNRCATARASTANNRDRFKRGVKRHKGESVFIGGGFAYQGTPALPLVKPPPQQSIRIQSERRRSPDPRHVTQILPKLNLQKNQENVKFYDNEEYENQPVKEPTIDLNGPRSSRRIRKRLQFNY